MGETFFPIVEVSSVPYRMKRIEFFALLIGLLPPSLHTQYGHMIAEGYCWCIPHTQSLIPPIIDCHGAGQSQETTERTLLIGQLDTISMSDIQVHAPCMLENKTAAPYLIRVPSIWIPVIPSNYG